MRKKDSLQREKISTYKSSLHTKPSSPCEYSKENIKQNHNYQNSFLNEKLEGRITKNKNKNSLDKNQTTFKPSVKQTKDCIQKNIASTNEERKQKNKISKYCQKSKLTKLLQGIYSETKLNHESIDTIINGPSYTLSKVQNDLEDKNTEKNLVKDNVSSKKSRIKGKVDFDSYSVKKSLSLNKCSKRDNSTSTPNLSNQKRSNSSLFDNKPFVNELNGEMRVTSKIVKDTKNKNKLGESQIIATSNKSLNCKMQDILKDNTLQQMSLMTIKEDEQAENFHDKIEEKCKDSNDFYGLSSPVLPKIKKSHLRNIMKKVSFGAKKKNLFPDEDLSETELFAPTRFKSNYDSMTSSGQALKNQYSNNIKSNYSHSIQRDKSNNSISRMHSTLKGMCDRKNNNIYYSGYRPGAQTTMEKTLKRQVVAMSSSVEKDLRSSKKYIYSRKTPKEMLKDYDERKMQMRFNGVYKLSPKEVAPHETMSHKASRSEITTPNRRVIILKNPSNPQKKLMNAFYIRKPKRINTPSVEEEPFMCDYESEYNYQTTERQRNKSRKESIQSPYTRRPNTRNQKIQTGCQSANAYTEQGKVTLDYQHRNKFVEARRETYQYNSKDKFIPQNKPRISKNVLKNPKTNSSNSKPKLDVMTAETQQILVDSSFPHLGPEPLGRDNFLDNLDRWRSRNDSEEIKFSKEAVAGVINYAPEIESSSCYLMIDGYKIFGKISDMNYGMVLVAENMNHEKKFAIKMIGKKFVLGLESEKIYDVAQTNMFVPSIVNKCPFFLQLLDIFQTNDHFYFVQELTDFVNLDLLMKYQGVFEETQVKFYSAGILLALNYLHRLNIIHRNLKLDNVLVDKHGYPKLADFGRSCFSINYKNGGTDEKISNDLEGLCNIQYVAPEVFCSPSHDRMVDYWSLGVCIQYMLTGKLVSNWRYLVDYINEMDESYTELATNLVKGLLKINPFMRLGSGPLGTVEIMNHPFYKVFSWDLYTRKEYVVPVPDSQCHTTFSQLNEESYNNLKNVVMRNSAPKVPITRTDEEQNKVELNMKWTAPSQMSIEVTKPADMESKPSSIAVPIFPSELSQQSISIPSSKVFPKSSQEHNLEVNSDSNNLPELDISNMLQEIKNELERFKSGCSGRTPQMNLQKLHTQDEMISKLMELKPCKVPFGNMSSLPNSILKNNSIPLRPPVQPVHPPNEPLYLDKKTNLMRIHTPGSISNSVLKKGLKSNISKKEKKEKMYDSTSTYSTFSSSSSDKRKKKSRKKKKIKNLKKFKSEKSDESEVEKTQLFKNPHQFIMNSLPSISNQPILKTIDNRYTGQARSLTNTGKKSKEKKHRKKRKYYDSKHKELVLNTYKTHL